MSEPIRVGMADYKIASGSDRLITLGLGSCVGIVLYSKIKNIGGMAHIMLPKSTEPDSDSLKFADVALNLMIKELESKGVKKSELEAKIAGGAKMFSFNNSDDKKSIGHRNTVSVKKILEEELKIEIVAEDTGGAHGRTIEFEVDTKILNIKTIGHGVKKI
ncbi:MAG: chemotaxis protein CheD [Fusobacteria bacterium]|nr:chemotaxis protein CheD [Fusobacteriota bacterium]